MPRPVRATEDQGSTKWLEAELPYRSVWLPIRIVGDQTAIGEADVIDEDSPKAKLIKPDATASCQLNLGRLTEVKTKGAVSSSVINVIPPIVPIPNRSR